MGLEGIVSLNLWNKVEGLGKLLDSILTAVGENIIPDILFVLVNPEMAFAKDICVEFEQLLC